MKISQLEDIRTNIGVDVVLSAGAVVGEVREVTAADPLKVFLDGTPAVVIVGTKPPGVSRGAARDILNVGVGFVGKSLGVISGGVDLRLLVGRAAIEASSFVVDAGDGEVTREFDLRGPLNNGVEMLGGTIGVDVDEEARRFDRVASCTRPGEVVRNGDWW